MKRAQRVRSSALWAAWGDALGFISELAYNVRGLRARIKSDHVTATQPWVRRVGGPYGITVELPAGCYSDDTQLRLATARAIRGDGRFDVRSFAKVELVVWLAYGLGGGRSTRAAAYHLGGLKQDWFTNFYGGASGPRYEEAGGNGAAMRIQPHVWAAGDVALWPSFLVDVVRNTVVSHGHPGAIVGTALHAGSLARTLETGSIPAPDEWGSLVDRLEVLPSLIDETDDLSTLWLPGWERVIRQSCEQAMATSIEECRQEVEILRRIALTDPRTAYEEMIIATRATDDKTRGSAVKTAALALALSWLRQDRPADGLLEAANVLGSDTDSIATMAGALLGAVHEQSPPGPTLDAEYITREADRMTAIADGQPAASFGYPDPGRWNPPSALSLIGTVNGQLALAGIGLLTETSSQWRDNGKVPAVWQWAQLDFGQSVLIRRRADVPSLSPTLLGLGWNPMAIPASEASPRVTRQATLFQESQTPTPRDEGPPKRRDADTLPPEHPEASWLRPPTVDEAFDDVRARNFDAAIVGRYLLQFSTRGADGHALAVAFAAMVAKAWRSRRVQV